jgi:hyperosmotically inducible periplasmic protein
MKLTNVLMAIAIAATVGFVSCKPKDADIKTALEEKIKATSELSGVSVDVKNGIATLTGELKDSTAIKKATELLKEIKGVKSITNNLVVTPALTIPDVVVNADTPLTHSVNDAVKDFTDVKASVKDGVVSLTGNIAKSSLPKLMMSLNSLHPKKIENKLTVK